MKDLDDDHEPEKFYQSNYSDNDDDDADDYDHATSSLEGADHHLAIFAQPV